MLQHKKITWFEYSRLYRSTGTLDWIIAPPVLLWGFFLFGLFWFGFFEQKPSNKCRSLNPAPFNSQQSRLMRQLLEIRCRDILESWGPLIREAARNFLTLFLQSQGNLWVTPLWKWKRRPQDLDAHPSWGKAGYLNQIREERKNLPCRR